jgi:hypothetical protein
LSALLQIVHCVDGTCGAVPVPDAELPVALPDLADDPSPCFARARVQHTRARALPTCRGARARRWRGGAAGRSWPRGVHVVGVGCGAAAALRRWLACAAWFTGLFFRAVLSALRRSRSQGDGHTRHVCGLVVVRWAARPSLFVCARVCVCVRGVHACARVWLVCVLLLCIFLCASVRQCTRVREDACICIRVVRSLTLRRPIAGIS